MICQQAVINLIDVGKIVNGLSFRILIVQPDFIMENRMKSNIFEAGRVFDFAKVAAIAVAQRKDGAPGPEHFLPVMRKRVAGRLKIYLNFFLSNLPPGDPRLENQEEKQNEMTEQGGRSFA